MFLAEVMVWWEGHQWVAYNNSGRRPNKHSTESWSTGLGKAEIDEVLIMFRRATIIVLPGIGCEQTRRKPT
jgi:hypothetical protein